MRPVLLVLAIIVWTSAVTANPPSKCEENAESKACGPGAGCSEHTCTDRKPCVVKSCGKPGCFCKENHVRKVALGPCIPVTQCPTNSIKQVCAENEEFKECGTGCKQLTCETKKKNEPCLLKSCGIGCFCKSGFVRKTDDGPCVAESECPT